MGDRPGIGWDPGTPISGSFSGTDPLGGPPLVAHQGSLKHWTIPKTPRRVVPKQRTDVRDTLSSYQANQSIMLPTKSLPHP
eukprot:351979-Chlamydomonas_euryale.AAC.3